ncbi:MAG: DUF371 domain-containing protein [Actinomycetota bacterium]|nr:DUF371 domain-containing protein [Actinomycetota bacterium]
MPAARSISGTALGHPNIRATHRKTLELTRESEIGPRATCVVGVAAELDEEALAGMHGWVALTLHAAARSEVVRGRLNPAWRAGDPLVVRRAEAVTRDAVLISADRAASALPRSFVTALADPAARIAFTVEERGGGPALPGVLGVRLIRFTHDGEQKGSIARPEVRSPLDDAALGRAREALAAGRRVELVADFAEDPRAKELVRWAWRDGHTVLPAPGLPLDAAVLAAAGLESGRVETDVPAEGLARRLRGAVHGAIVLDPGTPREQYLPYRAGEPLEIPGARGRRAAFAVELPDEAEALERARERAAEGASTRDVAGVLREGGLPHRRAYELALDLTAETSRVSRREPRTSR